MTDENDKTDLEKEELKKQKERERSRERSKKGYFKEWERRNKEYRKVRFLNKTEAELILKYVPEKEETKELINKAKKILNIRRE
jgi:hypothetical protein